MTKTWKIVERASGCTVLSGIKANGKVSALDKFIYDYITHKRFVSQMSPEVAEARYRALRELEAIPS